ncbi:MAG TPA: ABC transporter permease, partial [Petrotogaceae bacterium]|nr:ABC transporter permease [Petrotogaceae bacterium]
MNLINNELFKLHMKKRLFPFFILNFFADVMLISFVLIKKDSIFYSLINGQNFPLFSLEITTVFSIIFSCMSVYDLFIYEDKSGTLCNELLTPLKRKEVVFSKFNAIMIELGVFFVVNLIFSYTISSVFLQFGDVFSYCGVFLPFKEGLFKTIVSYILILFPLSGVTSFAILLYFLISKK